MTILNKILIVGKRELKVICTRYAIIVVLLGGIFLYGFLYNFMYGPNVVRNAPIAVVDMSRTPLSRKYARMLDATPQAQVISNNSDLPAAKELMKTLDAVGVVYIPSNFDQKVGEGHQAVFVLYSVTTAFLYYASMQEAAAGAMLAVNDNVRPNQVVFLPQKDIEAVITTNPITNKGTALFNYTNGYGTYLIPGVLAVIIFQTIIMIISMLSGKEREEMRMWNSYNHEEKIKSGSIPAYKIYQKLGVDNSGVPTYSTLFAIIIGKTGVYMFIYTFLCIFMIGVLPLMFQLPHLASPILIIQLMIPYLLATCFFSLACSFFFSDSDAPLLLISFFSVGLVFLSGISYPLENMPWYWQWSHFIIPAAPGTLAFVKINSMGASMAEISQQYIVLWIQVIIYFFIACWAYRYNMKRALRV